MADRPDLVTHRNGQKDAAILFVHGFGGNPTATWGRFPEFLMADPRLNGWDVFSLGYHTGLSPDVLRGLWTAQPEIHTLGELMVSTAGLPPLGRYRALAIVGHSMGGLVVQHALLDADFRRRVQHGLSLRHAQRRAGQGVRVRLLEAAAARHGGGRPVHQAPA
jgi:pimeloyl-ACP methyl ester carboxylesterase